MGGLKTQNAGLFLIPTAPAVGTTVAAGAANTFGSWVQMIASTSNPIYIVGIAIGGDGVNPNATYKYGNVAFGTGGAGSESTVGITGYNSNQKGAVSIDGCTIMLPVLIPVATSTRIAVQAANISGSQNFYISLICVNQSDVVDAGVTGAANLTQVNGHNVTDTVSGYPDVNVKYVNGLGIPIDSGTAQAIAATTITLRAGAPAVSLVGCLVLVDSATTGQGQVGFVTAYNTGTKQATINMWSQGVTPTGTITYVVFYPLG